MTSAALLSPFVVAAVLLVSGLAKLRDAPGVDAAFRSLRVPSVLDRLWVHRAFPWAEVALGALLVAAPSPLNVVAAAAALALMGVYLALVVAAVRRPEPADCHCFGTLTGGRVSRRTVARNALLVGAATIALADSFSGTPLVRLDPASVGWLLAVALTATLVATTVGDGGGATPAPTPPAPAPAGGVGGDDLEYVRLPIPYGELTDGGTPVTLRELARQRAVLLVWVSTTCASCSPVIDRLPAWREDLAPVDVRPVLTSLDGFAELAPELGPLALGDPGGHAKRLFDGAGVPMGVLLGGDGRLAGGPVFGPGAITELVDQMREQLAGG